MGWAILAPVISINVLGVDDWRVWRELRLAALADAPGAFRSTYAYWSGEGDTEANWRDRLAGRPLNLVLVLNADNAGMVSAAGPDDGGTVGLHSMWVAPFARGTGVADAAIGAVVEWSGRQNARAVELCVMATNEAAMRLYRRHGFVVQGAHADHCDELVMRRPGNLAP